MNFNLFYQTTNQADSQGELDVNPAMALEKIDAWIDGFVKLLPNLGIAILVAVIGYFVAKFVGKIIAKRLNKRDRPNLGTMLGGLVKWTLFILVFMLAITIVLPSINPGDLISGLGVSSVAIGFAFQDILQNWLAGLLILIRQPFEIGDQIIVNGYEGSVEKIETRATIIKTYSGERIVIPNNQIYTNAVKVKTAHELIRSQYDVGIGYGDSIEEAIDVITKAVNNVSSVDQEKGVEVLPWGLDASWVTLRVRWWTKSDRASVVGVMTQVLPAIKNACDDAHIDMPYNTHVQLIHDQTEAQDGDRSQQREGWPMSSKDQGTTPRWKAKSEMHDQQ